MSLQLLSSVNTKLQIALRFHIENKDLFAFLALSGFEHLHLYQWLDESLVQIRLKKYMLETYGQPVLDIVPPTANVFEPLTKGKNRATLTMGNTRDIVRESFIAYQLWEASALEEYEKTAKQLFNNGDIAAFNLIAEISSDVNAELARVSNMMQMLQSMDYDMPTAVSMQTEIQQVYKCKLNELRLI